MARQPSQPFPPGIRRSRRSRPPAAPRCRPWRCVLFVDGLRYDLGRRLADRLAAMDNLRLSWRLAPIPTVTATAKPLVTPVADAISGIGRADAFLPLESSSGRPATTDRLLAAMRARGMQILEKTETRGPLTPQTIGWSECGHLDSDGHHLGARLAAQIEAEIDSIARRVEALRRAGWARVQIVTDHGWLLVPGGLPKAVIAASIIETAWSASRCLVMAPRPRRARYPGIGTPASASLFRPAPAPSALAKNMRMAEFPRRNASSPKSSSVKRAERRAKGGPNRKPQLAALQVERDADGPCA